LQLVKGLPKGIGQRLYFSFSSAINAAPHRDSPEAREKLKARMLAVPDNRVLIGRFSRAGLQQYHTK
jgi:hypothetical protein